VIPIKLLFKKVGIEIPDANLSQKRDCHFRSQALRLFLLPAIKL
jgi:hypothetical protein